MNAEPNRRAFIHQSMASLFGATVGLGGSAILPFQVTATIASWIKRVDEQGLSALAQLREPVNEFADFVRYVVQQLKTLCPTLGKKMIAETLARARLHLGTTAGLMCKWATSTATVTRTSLAVCWGMATGG